MSSCDGWAPAVGADGSSSVCNPLLAGCCWLLGLYTLSKLPFYLCVPPPAHGLETGASLGCAEARAQPSPALTPLSAPSFSPTFTPT